MSLAQIVTNSIRAIRATIPDAMMSVLVASAVDVTPQPGEDYEPSWSVRSGTGFWEKVNSDDYPGSDVMTDDRTLVLVDCSADVLPHDYVNVNDSVYRVRAVKPELIGDTRILQKLLVGPENRGGISWVSEDNLVA